MVRRPASNGAQVLQYLMRFQNPLVIIQLVVIAVLLPFTPIGTYSGFVPPPARFNSCSVAWCWSIS